MTDLGEIAQRAACIAWLKRQLAAIEQGNSAEARQAMTAVRTVDALGPDGEHLGTLSRRAGSVSAKVTDERAYTRWVAEHHPEQIQQSVIESYTRKVRDQAKAHGHAVAPCKCHAGEIVPGVEQTVGDPTVALRLNDDAEQVEAGVAALWRAGTVTAETLQLAPTESTGAPQ